jgi:hypothetical protein
MASQIDPSIPHEGYAYTANVRQNFSTAQQEVTALQDQVVQLQTLLDQARQDINALQARQMAAMSAISSSPPDTSSQAFVTAGLNITFTPSFSTRGLFTAEGSLGNNSNSATSELQMIYGQGTPPAAGSLITDTNGTLVGALVSITTTRAGEMRPFSATALITDLLPGTPYWIGAAVRSATSGVAQLSEVTVTAFELLDPLPITP